MIVDRLEDIVVDRPISRETLRSVEQGYLVTCTETDCDWQGLFPSADLAVESIETHYERERSRGPFHRGTETWTIVELVDRATAYTVDLSSPGLGVDEQRLQARDGSIREFEVPRTTGDVSEIVERGDRVCLPADREQKVRGVTESRSHGLPVWSVGYCDVDDDLTRGDLPPRGQNELIARDGEIYQSFGPDPLASPAFEVVGEADHQADLSRFGGGASA